MPRLPVPRGSCISAPAAACESRGVAFPVPLVPLRATGDKPSAKLCNYDRRNCPSEAIEISDETLRSKNRWAIWLGIAITLGPLVPYAARSLGDRGPAELGMQTAAPSGTAMSYVPAKPKPSI